MDHAMPHGRADADRGGYFDAAGRYTEPPPREFIVGLDLGQSQDYSAMAVLEKIMPPPGTWAGDPAKVARYDVGHLGRAPLGTRYPVVVARTRERIAELDALRPRPRITLAIDQTGVGAAVADMFRERDGPAVFVPIVIHGGDAVGRDGDVYRVPKRELVGVASVLLHSGRLAIAEALPEAAILKQELTNFKAKIGLSGHDSYGAADDWRQSNHDDLVLAVAIAAWAGQHAGGGPIEPVSGELADFCLRHFG